MIKLLIFDFDGTLADSIGAIREAVNRALSHYGFPECSYDEVKDAIGGGVSVLARGVLPESEQSEERIDEFIKIYNRQYELTVGMTDRCYPGMHETLHKLIRRGYRLAVLSNKPDRFLRLLTENIFKDGEISYAAGQGSLPTKPDPAAPLMIAEHFALPPAECAFIGDSDVDIQTAKNAGMSSVGCSWGYRGTEVLRKAGADVIIDRPEELLAHFPDLTDKHI